MSDRYGYAVRKQKMQLKNPMHFSGHDDFHTNEAKHNAYSRLQVSEPSFNVCSTQDFRIDASFKFVRDAGLCASS